MNKKVAFFLLELLKQKQIKKYDILFYVSILMMVVFVFFPSYQIKIVAAENDYDKYRRGEILVKYKNEAEIKSIKLKQDENESMVVKSKSGKPELEFAELNYLYNITLIPSDTFYENQWYLKKIKAPSAWDITRESPNIVIAVIDTGVQINHPDLKENIWRNPKEIAGNNIDDDKNGYVDDINGWDFVNNVPDPRPKFKEGFTQDGILHGTIIAGIAAASGNNAGGISGVTWRASIMPLKALDDKGQGDTLSVIKAINYAIDNGADIINLSFVGYGYSHGLELAIKRAYQSGVIVVAAAGNEQKGAQGHLLDDAPLYPVCYDGKNGENMVIGVTATDAMDQKTPFAGYGFYCTDIVAPGVSIFSTSFYEPSQSYEGNLFNKYYEGYWAGTSMAVPMISGAAALIEETNPYLNRQQVIDLLFNYSDNINRLNPDFLGRLGRGRVNVAESVRQASQLLNSKKNNLITAVYSDGISTVKVSDKKGAGEYEFTAYSPGFKGGVNIASGDVNGDGADEIITGAGAGGGPHVRIFDSQGNLKKQFFAYGQSFKGGVNVASGDVNGDGADEIITGAGAGGGPQLRIFDGQGKIKKQFFAYGQSFKGGVNVASGDVNGDGMDEVITGPGPGGGPQVRILTAEGNLVGQFFAYEDSFRGGVKVAVGDINRKTRDHRYEIITSPVKNYPPLVKIFNSYGGLIIQFNAYDKKFKNGVNISSNDINYDGQDEIIAAPGPGGGPHVRIFSKDGQIISSFYAFSENFKGGVNVAGIKY